LPTTSKQRDLFEDPPALPAGMRHAPALISPAEERALIAELVRLPFREFEFHGFRGNRRTVSFGWRYDFNGDGLQQAGEMPEFLLPVRARAAAFAGLEPSALEHALLIEYAPGAGIGWHRDRPAFDDVVGVSLLSACTFRLRRKVGGGWERRSLVAEPRSAYLLRGPSRTEWEHSIPPLTTLRYSITFRSMARRQRPADDMRDAGGLPGRHFSRA
jgi:alkylated DNA repair dioxygenase AlkB